MRFLWPILYACLWLAVAEDLRRSTSGQRKSRELTQDEICREGSHFVCQDENCVPGANVRCDGIIQCEDGSDEQNCTRESGCILPQHPTGGYFYLAGCTGNSCNSVPGSIVPSGSYLTYYCRQGYTRIGYSNSYCHVNAWHQLPSCVRICPALRSDSVNIVYKYHGQEVPSQRKIVPGTRAILKCKDSYRIPRGNHPGYEEVTCLEDGVWDRAVFNCIPVCGTVVPRSKPMIVNGSRAEYGEFPWHVGIYRKNRHGNFDQICGGTLVSPNLVISAAHCFYDDNFRTLMNASNYMVVSGKFYRLYNMPDRYAQNSALKRIEKHEKFLGSVTNYANDIALVHLATRFTMTPFVRPICMDWDNEFGQEQLQNGTIGKVMGWGMNALGQYGSELQTVNLPYVDFSTCTNGVPDDFLAAVTNDKFCAGYLNGSSVCTGDSGGGLCFKHDRVWYLRGIVSTAPQVSNTIICHGYSTFTNVGTFLEWIRQVVLRSSNLPGKETGASEYATTLAPFNGRITTAIATLSGCILPEQPTHGSFELSPCERPCNVAAGTRVPNNSSLTYRCNGGYALNGNNTVTVCTNNVWYPPSACPERVPGNYCSALKSNSKSVVCKYRDGIVPCGSEMRPGTRATLVCESQHVIPSLEDPQYTLGILCLDNGTWDRPGIECTYECGTRVSDGTQFVVNGSRVRHGKFPWRVDIYKKYSSFFGYIGWGVLISPGLVITKDEYSKGNVTASDFAIGTGDSVSYYTPGTYVQTSLVQSIHNTEEKYGIALLRLKTPVTMTALVRPICIDWENRVVTEAIESRANDQTGRTINRPYIPYRKCLSRFREHYNETSSTDVFCTFLILKGSQVGDLWDNGYTFGYLYHGSWYLLGVYRTDVSPGVHMFTEIGPRLNWIRAAYNARVG